MDAAIVDRMPGQTVVACAMDGDTAVGACLGIVDAGWLGIVGMVTSAEHRRQGVASSVLASLLTWGYQAGARNAWLQVEQSNVGARELYANHGFSYSHGYHYRRRKLRG